MRWALVVAMFVLGAATPAHAGTVTLTTKVDCACDYEAGGTEYTTYTLRWSGAAGEANSATVSWSAGAFHLKDTSAPVTAGAGCNQVALDEASCGAPSDCLALAAGLDCSYTFDMVLDGADGDDVLSAGPLRAVVSAAGAITLRTMLALDGGDGDDTLNGSREGEVLRGGAGTDTLHGGAGDDVLVGDGIAPASAGEQPPDAPPADVIDGGAGADTVSYSARHAPVTVDLAAGTGGEPGEGDELSAVENVDGGTGDDILIGDAHRNEVFGARGSDRIDGGAGNDDLDGGAGGDDLHGGIGDDILHGDGVGNPAATAPPDWEPQIPPVQPSRDLLDGGPGTDAASWSTTTERVVVDLSKPGPDGEPAAPDTLTSIENVEAGAGHDTLIGDDGPNVLDGGRARGTIIGKGGADTLLAGSTAATVDGGRGNDLIRGGSARTTCGSGIDRISPLDRYHPVARDCELLAMMHDGWDPIRGALVTPALELPNAPAHASRTAVTLRARCPRAVCAGVLELNPDYRVNDGARPLRLRARAWHEVKLELNGRGRRRIARHAQIALWLSFGDAYAPLVLRRLGG